MSHAGLCVAIPSAGLPSPSCSVWCNMSYCAATLNALISDKLPIHLKYIQQARSSTVYFFYRMRVQVTATFPFISRLVCTHLQEAWEGQLCDSFPIIRDAPSNECVQRLARLNWLNKCQRPCPASDPGAVLLVGLASPLPHFNYMGNKPGLVISHATQFPCSQGSGGVSILFIVLRFK